MKKVACIGLFLVSLTLGLSAQNISTKGGSNSSPNTTSVTIEGTWESKKGVMDVVSCYGSNAGYVEDAVGNRTMVSFDQMPNGSNLNVSGSYLKATGHYETITPPSGGVCASDPRQIFIVESYEVE